MRNEAVAVAQSLGLTVDCIRTRETHTKTHPKRGTRTVISRHKRTVTYQLLQDGIPIMTSTEGWQHAFKKLAYRSPS
jgi:hypothetical protein